MFHPQPAFAVITYYFVILLKILLCVQSVFKYTGMFSVLHKGGRQLDGQKQQVLMRLSQSRRTDPNVQSLSTHDLLSEVMNVTFLVCSMYSFEPY